MTEAEWLASDDLEAMLEFLRTTGKVSDRKLRLFAVACCRRLYWLNQEPFGEEDIRIALDTSEQRADGDVTPEALAALRRRLLSHPIAGCPAGYDLNYAAQPFWAPIAALEFIVLAVALAVSDPVDAPETARLAAFAEAANWFSEQGPAYAFAHLADHVARLGSGAGSTFAASFRRGAALYRKRVLTDGG
jgi:hypothetical protein